MKFPNILGGNYSKTLGKLRSPALLSFARDHFGCLSLDGIELEDFGGSGTAGSHWESRVAGMELMVSTQIKFNTIFNYIISFISF